MRAALDARQQDLNELAEAFQRFRTFIAELRRATKGKPFEIRSRVLWEAVQGHYRMLVIDLGDWVDNLCPNKHRTGWLRKHLQGAALANLRNSNSLAQKLADAPHRQRLVLEHRHAALKRLFGRAVAKRGRATFDDLEKLERRLERWSRNLRDWRNVHAHRLEGIVAKPLRLEDLARRFRYCGRLMNAVRLLVENSTYHMPSLEPHERDTHARDLVDLLVVGDIQTSAEEWKKEPGEWLWQKRDAHYVRLHARRRKSVKQSFNLTPFERGEET